jgi:ankyrin repeat protein
MLMKIKGHIATALLAITFSATAADQPFIEAVKHGDIDAVITLLDNGADVDQPAADGTSALTHAAYRNDLAMLEMLLFKGEARVGVANDYGATALYVAAARADTDLVERLLRAGADADASLLSGETPLMVASNRGRLEVAKLLLEYGADPNAKETSGGQTALMWAAAAQHPEVVEVLTKHKADVNARSNTEFTALMFAAQQGNALIAEQLIKRGARVNDSIGKSGLTPLMIAGIGGFEDLANVLLDHGANADAIDKNGKAVLHHAVTYTPSAAIVRELLARGAKPDIRLQSPKPYSGDRIDPQGATPLLVAAGFNNLQAVTALLEAGADPGIPTAQNTTALMMAAGADVGIAAAISDAGSAKATQIARLLLDLDLDVNAAGQYGWTALHSAAYHGRNEIIKDLVARGANVETLDSFGQTPLSICHAIVTEGMGDDYAHTPRTYRRETAELLLSLGATPLEKSGVRIVTARVGGSSN